MSADDLNSLPPTAPGGGDFGVALNNRTDTIDESSIGGPSRLKLKVRPSPPPYPYADSFFTFEVRNAVVAEMTTERCRLLCNDRSEYVSLSPEEN